MKPVWKKVSEIEPGLYWYGGYGDVPYVCLRIVRVANCKKLNFASCWYARIGDVPPEPEMPRPDLKDGDPVMVRDWDTASWDRRHFAKWDIDGSVRTWTKGSKWASNGQTVHWVHYRLPTQEELAD